MYVSTRAHSFAHTHTHTLTFSSVSGNVHVDVLFQYAMIIVVLLLYIDETKIKIINSTFVRATSRFVWAQSSTFSTRYIIAGAIRPMLHQCDITSTAPECPMLLCFKQQLCLFLAIIVLLFFIQIVYNFETEAVIHYGTLSRCGNCCCYGSL